MAPPGRRRALSALSVLLTLLFFTSTASAVSAVLGIDLGTEYIKAALVKPGIPLEIVLTKDSKRKEVSAVAFKPSGKGPVALGQFPERLYGGDALALAGRFPGDVYPNLKPLLGITAQNSDVTEEYLKRHPALDLVAVKERGTVGFKSGSFDKQELPYSVEELLAMQLKNVRENAETLAGKGSRIEDAVVTIPAFYTADERRAVELAVRLAGMNTLSLMTDGLAVGLNYATSRTFSSISEGGKPEYHVVYDMGAGSATATILKMQGRSVKDVGRYNKTIQEVQVLGAGWLKSLGGDSLNALIMDDMIDQFVGSSEAKSADVQADAVRKHGRAASKLWKEAERIRHVLSANQDTSASFESLYEDVDFRYKLSRSKFEDMASEFVTNVETPIHQALVVSQLQLEDIDSIILHGGATRTPFVQKKLEAFVGDAAKLRSNVNADEAAVFGAAFRGAGLSPSFRVKEIRDSEIATYPIKLRWTDESKERQQNLFVPSSQVGGPPKEVSFKNLDDFSFRMTQSVPSKGGPLVERPVSVVRSKNLTDSVSSLTAKFGCTREEISTKFRIRLNPVDGLPEVTKATVSCEVDDEKKANVVDGVKDFFGFGSKKGDQEPLNEGEEGPAEPLESNESETFAESSSGGPSSTESGAKESAKAKTPKKRTEIVNVAFVLESEGLPTPTKAELDRVNERLSAFASSDRTRRLREEALNSLEGYTYRTRDVLTDESFIGASTEAQRSTIEKLLSSTSEWLHDEGSSATLEVLRQKLKDLENLVKPIQSRKDEVSKRPDQIKSLQDALEQTNTFIGAIRKQIDEASSAVSSAFESAASASASSSSAAASASSSSSSATSTTVDELADLEEPDTSSSSSTTEETPQPTKYTDISPYTEEDLTSLISTHTSIANWLKETLAKQDKLRPHEDPALRLKDIEAKSRELNQATMELLQRKIRTPPKPKTKSSAKKSSSKKPKSSKTTSTAKATESGDGEGGNAEATGRADAGGEKPPIIRVGEGEEMPSEEEILRMVEEARGKQKGAGKEKERVVDEL
ncbi:putative Hsp70 family chaperone Lhs1/Orp150 [Viridothelium virens]|uniref:Putative Hsp70 family chaperone Lhs1/Orp150 n=1 Tax=Viridothelium virens TaxID=1048519 RepID=A0A6A6H1F0_VIRVR|nr:putative Hsp70 family chaperone Lhs1/Orp150 [Viridothelium virens]